MSIVAFPVMLSLVRAGSRISIEAFVFRFVYVILFVQFCLGVLFIYWSADDIHLFVFIIVLVFVGFLAVFVIILWFLVVLGRKCCSQLES